MSERRSVQLRPVAPSADKQAEHAVAAKFHIEGRDPALDALRAALEGFRATRAEVTAEVCPCGEGNNPLHAFLNHGGGR